MSASDGAAQALAFCRSSDTAAIATVWPTAHSQVAMCRDWLRECGASIVHEQEVELAQACGSLACMALYHGEEWLETNCWYGESPLPSGPPPQPWAGAKWKAALAFRQQAPMHVFVVDAGGCGGAIWSGKYGIRGRMMRAVGSIGNSCLHLTDDQSQELGRWRAGGGSRRGGGMECDSSYAYHCARVLLNPHSVAFLNREGPGAGDLSDQGLIERFSRYCAWLGDPAFADVGGDGGFPAPGV